MLARKKVGSYVNVVLKPNISAVWGEGKASGASIGGKSESSRRKMEFDDD